MNPFLKLNYKMLDNVKYISICLPGEEIEKYQQFKRV